MASKRMTERDRHEIEKFQRFLAISKWREDELGEKPVLAHQEAALIVYGDRFAEGSHEN